MVDKEIIEKAIRTKQIVEVLEQISAVSGRLAHNLTLLAEKEGLMTVKEDVEDDVFLN